MRPIVGLFVFALLAGMTWGLIILALVKYLII
jgi:hypothetical protein